MTAAPPSRLVASLPPADPRGATHLLAIGASPELRDQLRAAGYQVSTHTLDDRPLAALAGEPFTPPETTWPFPDATADAILLLDQLAFVVDDEAAIAEAARVLKPGGSLILRVPSAGPLAWIDAYNLFRYLRDGTGRGPRVTETRGNGWRRQYHRRDMKDLLTGRFTSWRITSQGLGLGELTRFALMFLFRWLVHWEGVYQRADRIVPRIKAAESHLSPGPFGADLLVTSEQSAVSHQLLGVDGSPLKPGR